MYNVFKLSNGLRIVLEKIDYVNSISIGLWVKNGSRNEDTKNNGISHFIEHMLFKGTTNRSAKKIAEDIEDVGGQLNAFTSKESTCYYVKILNTHTELALDVLSDMLFNSKFLEEDIEREKGVIIEEINMNEDSPEDVLVDLHSKAIWGDDSIALPILGTEENVKSFTREQIVNYLKSHYVPQNSVISIAGNFDDSIYSLLEKYFGNWHSDNENITVFSTPKILSNNLFKKKNIEQLHMSLGLEGLELGNDLIYTLLLLNNILGGGAASILFQKIREEMGRCYSIYSYVSALNNTGVITIYTGLNSKYSIEVLELIKTELEKFIKTDFSKEKIFKGKEQLKGSYILGLESTSSRMFNNGKSVLLLDKINKPEDIIKKIDAIDEDKIKEVMDLTFKKGIMNSAYVGQDVDLSKIDTIIEKDKNLFNLESKDTLI